MLGRKLVLILSSRFLVRFLGWIGILVLVRFWTIYADTALGIIGFAMSFLAIFNIVGDLGFSRAHVKRISEGKDLGTCIGTYATIKFVLIGIMVAALFVAIFILKNVMNYNFPNQTTESVIYLLIFYYIFFNLGQIITATFEGTGEIAKKQTIHIFEAVKTPLFIIVALAGVSGKGVSEKIGWPSFLQSFQQYLADHAVHALAVTSVLAMISCFIVGMWLIRKYPIKKPNWSLFKSYFNFGIPMMLFTVIGVISVNVDKLMIGYFWQDQIYQVGYYYTFQQLLQILTIVYLALDVVLFPTISKFHSYKDHSKIKKTTLLAERYISMVMVPIVVIIIVFVGPVIRIMLSKEFVPAASVFIVLTIYTFIFSLNRPYVSLISGMNRPAVLTKIAFVICLVNIPLNYLFIPRNGLLISFGINGPTGAAIATVISVTVGFIIIRFSAKKIAKMNILQTHTPRHIIAGFIMGITLYYLSFNVLSLDTIRWYILAPLALLGTSIYIAVLFIIKEFKKQDLSFFLDIINPKEMVKYVSKEFKDKSKKQ